MAAITTRQTMDTEQILFFINQAIANLFESEKDILERGLNERILSSRFADYLRPLFNEFDVDPEYNGDIDKPNDRKALDIAKNRLTEIGYKPNQKNNYKLSPDIIIHKRGSNENNLVVIEVKKDSSPERDKDYDLIKLEHLTIDYLGNHYNYELGVAIIFGTGKNTGSSTKIFFQSGLPKTEQTLT